MRSALPSSPLRRRLTLHACLLCALLPLVACEDPAVVEAAKSVATTLILDGNSKISESKATLGRMPKRLEALPKDQAELAALNTQLSALQATLPQLEAKYEQLDKTLEEKARLGKKRTLDEFSETLKVEFVEADKFAASVTALSATVTALEQAAAAASAAAAPKEALTPFAKTLPSGHELKAFTEGIEHQLLGFLDDANSKIDDTSIFTFDRLTFLANGTGLDEAKSKPQLDNLAAILKAYPKLKLTIGGYTDTTGETETNKKLSLDRAVSVQKALVAAGVEESRLKAEGYGPENPVCAANDTDECKAQNRRIAARVTEK
jgi:outer membrane protein OmpA-like peptidoglycan-associated protein